MVFLFMKLNSTCTKTTMMCFNLFQSGEQQKLDLKQNKSVI